MVSLLSFYGFAYSRHCTPRPSVASVNLLAHFQGSFMFLLKYVLLSFLWTEVQGRILPQISVHHRLRVVSRSAPWPGVSSSDRYTWAEVLGHTVILSGLLSNCTIWHSYQQRMRVPSATSAPTTVTAKLLITAILPSWTATSPYLNLHFLTTSSYVLMEKHLFSYLSHF